MTFPIKLEELQDWCSSDQMSEMYTRCQVKKLKSLHILSKSARRKTQYRQQSLTAHTWSPSAAEPAMLQVQQEKAKYIDLIP